MIGSRRGLCLVSVLLAWSACAGRAAEESRGAATGAGGQCSIALSDATIWLLGAERGTGEVDAVEITPVVFDRKPDVGSAAWVVPYPRGEAVRVKISGAGPAETGPGWLVRLEDARETPLRTLKAPPGRRPEAPSDAAVLWPAPDAAPRVVAPAPADLPKDVAPGTVSVAIDVDRDSRADLLLVEFCCGDRASRTDCEYSCGETWQRAGGSWRRCFAWQPA